MRKLLLATAMLVGVAGAAFATQPTSLIASGDINSATTSAASNAGVASVQGTSSGAMLNGNGSVKVGTISGNYTSVSTGAMGIAGSDGSITHTTATQTNTGGTTSFGDVSNFGHNSKSVGITGGSQTSTATGASNATASNSNIGGFVNVSVPPAPTHHR